VISSAERQARWRTRRSADIEALRAATTKAELALAQAKNDLLRQRVLDLETALARRESGAKFAQTKAISEIARLKEKNKELQAQLRQMWDRYNKFKAFSAWKGDRDAARRRDQGALRAVGQNGDAICRHYRCWVL
jgi:hypothetical protein